MQVCPQNTCIQKKNTLRQNENQNMIDVLECTLFLVVFFVDFMNEMLRKQPRFCFWVVLWCVLYLILLTSFNFVTI